MPLMKACGQKKSWNLNISYVSLQASSPYRPLCPTGCQELSLQDHLLPHSSLVPYHSHQYLFSASSLVYIWIHPLALSCPTRALEHDFKFLVSSLWLGRRLEGGLSFPLHEEIQQRLHWLPWWSLLKVRWLWWRWWWWQWWWWRWWWSDSQPISSLGRRLNKGNYMSWIKCISWAGTIITTKGSTLSSKSDEAIKFSF